MLAVENVGMDAGGTVPGTLSACAPNHAPARSVATKSGAPDILIFMIFPPYCSSEKSRRWNSCQIVTSSHAPSHKFPVPVQRLHELLKHVALERLEFAERPALYHRRPIGIHDERPADGGKVELARMGDVSSFGHNQVDAALCAAATICGYAGFWKSFFGSNDWIRPVFTIGHPTASLGLEIPVLTGVAKEWREVRFPLDQAIGPP